MSKVSVTLGLTLKMQTGGGYNFFRPEICISDIETETDIAPQIERSLAALNEVWAAIEENMGTIIDSSEIAENPSALTEIHKRIAIFEADVGQLKTRLAAGDGAVMSVSVPDSKDKKDKKDDDW